MRLQEWLEAITTPGRVIESLNTARVLIHNGKVLLEGEPCPQHKQEVLRLLNLSCDLFEVPGNPTTSRHLESAKAKLFALNLRIITEDILAHSLFGGFAIAEQAHQIYQDAKIDPLSPCSPSQDVAKWPGRHKSIQAWAFTSDLAIGVYSNGKEAKLVTAKMSQD